MYFILYVTICSIIYVKSFKDDFTKEHLDKVTGAMIIILIITIALSILTSLLK